MKLFRGKMINSTKINTSGYCFICLESSGVVSLYSRGVSPGIGTLLRYLKINQGSDASSDEIEVYLCQSCEKINSRISTLCQQLEKIRMEVNYFVDGLHHRISKSFEPDLIKNFSKTMTADPKSSHLQYVTDLRAEISQKSKSMQTGPQLRVNLSRSRVNTVVKEESSKSDDIEDSPSSPLSPSFLPSSPQSNTEDISDHSESVNCCICGKEFSSIGFKNALEQLRCTHKKGSPMFQCSECDIKSKISWLHNKKEMDNGNVDSDKEPEVKQSKDTIKTVETTENIKDLLEIVRKEVPGFNITSNPIDEVDFSEDTSEFKKFVLSTLLKINKPVLKSKMSRLKHFKKRTEGMEKNSAEYLLEEFKIQEKFQFFEYEPISKTVRLKTVLLEINEQEHFVKCCECQSKRRLSWPRPSNQFPTEFKRGLMEHILEKHLNIFQCSVKSCEDKTKYNSVDYLGHLKGHLGSKHGFECNICGRPFLHKHMVKIHLLTHKSAEERGQKSTPCFQCATCGKKKKSLGMLHAHEQIHKDRKRTLCPDCGKSVLDLKTHKRMTCTVPTLKCFHCEKMFKTEKERRSHVNRIHSDNSGPRSFICDKCSKSKSFRFEKDLKRHIKQVHEFVEKKHFCRGGCGAKFPLRYYCKRHERTCKVLKQLSIIK